MGMKELAPFETNQVDLIQLEWIGMGWIGMAWHASSAQAKLLSSQP